MTKSTRSIAQNVAWMVHTARRECRSVLWLGLCCGLLDLGLNLVQLFLAPGILQQVERAAPLTTVLTTIAGFTAALLVLRFLRAYLDENLIFGRIDVRQSLIRQIGRKAAGTSYENTLDPAFLREQERAYDLVNDNDQASEHLWTTLTTLLTTVLGFAIYLSLLTAVDGRLLAVVLVTNLVSFPVTLRTGSWRYRHREEENKGRQQLDYLLRQSTASALAKDIRVFGLQDWLMDLYDGVLRLQENFLRRAGLWQLLGNGVEVVLSVARNGVAYGVLLSMTWKGGLSASEFLLYFSAVSGFSAWVTALLEQGSTLRRECRELSMIRDYLDWPEPFRFADGAPVPRADGYELRLENVSYRYPGAAADTIHKLDLTVRPGEKLAIVGLNGAGKTTLVKLLGGFLDPTAGRVLLNGQDIREFDRRDYYRLFSAVFQDFSVLSVSIAEQVAQSATPDRDRVARCLHQAGLTEKVDSLPKGMDTQVGRAVYEDGVELSGGELQRLMLARALYKDGPILLLDEPTAALDPIAEGDIYEKYNDMTAGKTALFISHRLASTRFCDRIVFLRDGAIAEEGTHDQLLARNGGYAALFAVQSRYYQEGRNF